MIQYVQVVRGNERRTKILLDLGSSKVSVSPSVFDILKFSLALRLRGRQQWKLNGMFILSCRLCRLGPAVKLICNISKMAYSTIAIFWLSCLLRGRHSLGRHATLLPVLRDGPEKNNAQLQNMSEESVCFVGHFQTEHFIDRSTIDRLAILVHVLHDHGLLPR